MTCRVHAAKMVDCGQLLVLSMELVNVMFALAVADADAAAVEEENCMLLAESSTNSCRHARQPWVA